MSMNNEGNEVRLERAIGFWPLVFFGVVLMVPTAGVTYLPITFEWTGGHTWIGYGITVILTILSVMSYQRMFTVFYQSGSAYTYTSATVNNKVGFVVGWATLIDNILGPSVTLALMAQYFTPIFPNLPTWITILAAGIIMMVCLCLGIKTSVMIEIFIGIYSLVFVLAFIFLGTNGLDEMGVNIFSKQMAYHGETADWSGILGVASLGVLFLPFDGMSTMSEEVTMSRKKFGWAIMTAVLIQSVFLLLSAYVGESSIRVMDIPEGAMDTAYVYLFALWTSPTIANVILLIGNITTIAALTAYISVGCRVMYNMGRDGLLPKRTFGYLHPRFKTPTFDAVLMSIIVILGAWFIDIEIGSCIVSFGITVSIIATNVCCFLYFWVQKKERRVFRHLIFPLVSAAGFIFILCCQNWICLAVGSLWVLAGILLAVLSYKFRSEFRQRIDSDEMEL